jgi:hypothetical protein
MFKVHHPGQSIGVRFVVHEDGEPVALQHELEVPDTHVAGVELPVKGRVLLLHGIHLLGEGPQRLSRLSTRQLLLQTHAHM